MLKSSLLATPYALLTFVLLLLFSCTATEKADLIIHNALVYTVDSSFTVVQAFAVKDGRFLESGSNEQILKNYKVDQTIDAGGKAVYPGFIDAHCHFLRYGLSLQNADLTGTTSFGEIIERIQAHRNKYPAASWIVGRGWDQNDWPEKAFPTKDTLDLLFPDTPVFLERIDGHAALVNQKALDLAGVTTSTRVSGGLVELKNNEPTGILVDNAADLVSRVIPQPGRQEVSQALQQAEKNCFAVGLTTVDDAGLGKAEVDLIDSLQKAKGLTMRMYVMLNPSQENQDHYFTSGPYKTDQLNVRSFKIYADGALGSRGACLLHDYHDRPGNKGFLLQTPQDLKNIATALYQHNFQMNTHCIGDSANRLLLDFYGGLLKGKNDRRWRIEHAQVVATTDVAKFGEYSVIPSVQPTHATSDMYWAGERLGETRVKTAYAFQDLYKQNQTIAFGSDFPVEAIEPLYGFHAAVARQDAKNYPKGGFQPENAMTREQALRGMTIWAAYSNFEEKEKGSIEKGKFADFVILEKDIMKASNAELRNIKVAQTFVGGKQVYSR
ncbi:amidohydrolase [Rhodocytophaga aerolata]|uniref:Amidohydrolase n=1 Tax=Rhodocytophaga aerolata TaxID=455078 RepID=A0ABT8RAT2_9BACT|nr:amidohydrolase [Rhodocytophaga aerolata]MDO1448434.1 amidohydrolase [Rhodocytophaga aerolata]